MVHNKSNSQSGSALLISVLFLSILLTLILAAQIVVIRQNYIAVYNDGRSEQTSYNALANIANAIWNYVNKLPADTTRIEVAGEYENTGVVTEGLPEPSENRVTIQSGSSDVRRQLQVHLGTAPRPRLNYADIVLMLDQSGSTAINNYTSGEYSSCLGGKIDLCSCLIPDLITGRINCQPFSGIYNGASTFLSIFRQEVTNIGDGIIYKHELLNKLSFIIAPDNLNPPNNFKNPPILTTDYIPTNDENNFLNEVSTYYIKPSGLSTLGEVVVEITDNFDTYFTSINSSDPDDQRYNFLVLMTDGSPTTWNPTSISCADPYEGSSGGNGPCFNVRLNITSRLASHNANQDNALCTIVLGYGDLLNPGVKKSQHAYNFVTGNVDISQPNLTNVSTNGRCPPSLDLDPSTTNIKEHYIIVDPLITDISTALGNIANRISLSLNSIRIKTQDPDPNLNPE